MSSMLDKFRELINPMDDDDDDFEEEYIEKKSYKQKQEKEAKREEETKNEVASFKEEPAPSFTFKKPSKVVTMNNRTYLQVVVYKPVSFGKDTRAIATSLMEKNAVVLNLEKTKKEEAARILDFLSGVALAQDGKINKIATSTYIISPIHVELTGDEIFDEFENNGYYF